MAASVRRASMFRCTSTLCLSMARIQTSKSSTLAARATVAAVAARARAATAASVARARGVEGMSVLLVDLVAVLARAGELVDGLAGRVEVLRLDGLEGLRGEFLRAMGEADGV